ncbi:MAG TPA: site-specific integrase [Terriglobia bacterium]|nr:site-specific integrase [Terriglobia bacterium]
MGNQSPAGIRVRSESSIEIDFYYRGVRCRERIKLQPTEKNIKYCERLKARVEDEIAKNEFDYAKHFPDSPKVKFFAKMPGDKITIETYLQRWLECERQNVKSSTWRGYEKILRGHLIPGFGKLCLSDLRRKHVKEWASQRTMTPKTLGNVLSPLRIALDDAVLDEFIEHNPLAGWKIKRRRSGGRGSNKSKARQIDPFSSEERDAILSAVDDQGRNFVKFAFWTGLRTSELCALDWADIDWVRNVVRVSRALTQGSDEAEEPKTEAGVRDVKLLPPALEALKAQKAYTFLKGAEVFQNPRSGERWTGDQAIRKTLWLPALKRAGVRYRNPYQTRHTYASMMLMAGEHVMWVAKQMGHTDWAFTARTYSRWIPDDAPDAGNKAVALWSQSGHGTHVSH